MIQIQTPENEEVLSAYLDESSLTVASQTNKSIIFRKYVPVGTEFHPLMVQGLSMDTKKVDLLQFCDKDSCIAYTHGGESIRYFVITPKGIEEAKLKFGQNRISLDSRARASKENGHLILYYVQALKNAHGQLDNSYHQLSWSISGLQYGTITYIQPSEPQVAGSMMGLFAQYSNYSGNIAIQQDYFQKLTMKKGSIWAPCEVDAAQNQYLQSPPDWLKDYCDGFLEVQYDAYFYTDKNNGNTVVNLNGQNVLIHQTNEQPYKTIFCLDSQLKDDDSKTVYHNEIELLENTYTAAGNKVWKYNEPQYQLSCAVTCMDAIEHSLVVVCNRVLCVDGIQIKIQLPFVPTCVQALNRYSCLLSDQVTGKYALVLYVISENDYSGEIAYMLNISHMFSGFQARYLQQNLYLVNNDQQLRVQNAVSEIIKFLDQLITKHALYENFFKMTYPSQVYNVLWRIMPKVCAPDVGAQISKKLKIKSHICSQNYLDVVDQMCDQEHFFCFQQLYRQGKSAKDTTKLMAFLEKLLFVNLETYWLFSRLLRVSCADILKKLYEHFVKSGSLAKYAVMAKQFKNSQVQYKKPAQNEDELAFNITVFLVKQCNIDLSSLGQKCDFTRAQVPTDLNQRLYQKFDLVTTSTVRDEKISICSLLPLFDQKSLEQLEQERRQKELEAEQQAKPPVAAFDADNFQELQQADDDDWDEPKKKKKISFKIKQKTSNIQSTEISIPPSTTIPAAESSNIPQIDWSKPFAVSEEPKQDTSVAQQNNYAYDPFAQNTNTDVQMNEQLPKTDQGTNGNDFWQDQWNSSTGFNGNDAFETKDNSTKQDPFQEPAQHNQNVNLWTDNQEADPFDFFSQSAAPSETKQTEKLPEDANADTKPLGNFGNTPMYQDHKETQNFVEDPWGARLDTGDTTGSNKYQAWQADDLFTSEPYHVDNGQNGAQNFNQDWMQDLFGTAPQQENDVSQQNSPKAESEIQAVESAKPTEQNQSTQEVVPQPETVTQAQMQQHPHPRVRVTLGVKPQITASAEAEKQEVEQTQISGQEAPAVTVSSQKNADIQPTAGFSNDQFDQGGWNQPWETQPGQGTLGTWGDSFQQQTDNGQWGDQNNAQAIPSKVQQSNLSAQPMQQTGQQDEDQKKGISVQPQDVNISQSQNTSAADLSIPQANPQPVMAANNEGVAGGFGTNWGQSVAWGNSWDAKPASNDQPVANKADDAWGNAWGNLPQQGATTSQQQEVKNNDKPQFDMAPKAVEEKASEAQISNVGMQQPVTTVTPFAQPQTNQDSQWGDNPWGAFPEQQSAPSQKQEPQEPVPQQPAEEPKQLDISMIPGMSGYKKKREQEFASAQANTQPVQPAKPSAINELAFQYGFAKKEEQKPVKTNISANDIDDLFGGIFNSVPQQSVQAAASQASFWQPPAAVQSQLQSQTPQPFQQLPSPQASQPFQQAPSQQVPQPWQPQTQSSAPATMQAPQPSIPANQTQQQSYNRGTMRLLNDPVKKLNKDWTQAMSQPAQQPQWAPAPQGTQFQQPQQQAWQGSSQWPGGW